MTFYKVRTSGKNVVLFSNIDTFSCIRGGPALNLLKTLLSMKINVKHDILNEVLIFGNSFSKDKMLVIGYQHGVFWCVDEKKVLVTKVQKARTQLAT